MAKIVRDVHTLTEMTFFALEIEVPDAIIAIGEKAITHWMNENIRAVDAAKYRHHSSNNVRVVESIDK